MFDNKVCQPIFVIMQLYQMAEPLELLEIADCYGTLETNKICFAI